jgi:hypothetical protein
MTPCLRPDEIIDYVDGVLEAERASHLAACSTCRTAAADAHATLAAVAASEIPEPSPFFWASINRRVATAISQPTTVGTGWRSWLTWDPLLPVAAIAAVLVALAASLARAPVPRAPATATAAAAARNAETAAATTADLADNAADDALALVVDLAHTLPEAGADALALAPLPDLGDVAATALADDELQALEAILHAAVDRPKS